MSDVAYTFLLDALVWGAFIYWLSRNKKTNALIAFVMMSYLVSFFAAILVLASRSFFGS